MFSRRDMNPIDIACPPTFTFLLIYGDFDNFHLVSLSPNLSLSILCLLKYPVKLKSFNNIFGTKHNLKQLLALAYYSILIIN